MATAKEVYDSIMQYINSVSTNYPSWYVGIASDPKSRLFNDHKVSETFGKWIFQDTGSEETARTVEKYIIDTHKTKGDTGGGDKTTTSVYAYLITNATIE